MFNKITLVYSEKLCCQHLKAVENIKRIIRESGAKCSSVKADILKKKYFTGADLVVSAGGDGAFIRASHYLNEIPILGINSEPEMSEGALLSLKDDETRELEKILSGEFNIIKRERAGIRLNNKTISYLVLCEAYVGAINQFHTSRYKIKFNGKEEEQRSSGVVISTGTGSTAWYKSAGGKPFPYDLKKLKFLVREPYFGKRLFNPKLLDGEINKDNKVIFESTRYSGGVVAIDSEKIFDFNTGDVVEVFLSKVPLNVLVKKEEK